MKYLVILLRLFAEYTSLIRNTRDATINYIWNIYNILFDHLDAIQDQFWHKDLGKTPWILEFITVIDTGIEKLKEYYCLTGDAMEMQYTLAAMLNPSQKLGIFASLEWGRSWSKKYQKEFVDYLRANYQNLAITGDNQPRAPMALQTLNGIF